MWLVLALLLTAGPLGVFYFVLWKNAVSIPIFDDYDNVLTFANQFARIHGFFNRFWMVLTFQHNEYKLIFENAIVAGQYILYGRIHFLPLVALGNAFAVLIFALVCYMFRATEDDQAKRAWLLVPVAYLLFQLQYASALDWASSSLQHLAVIFFVLLSIHLITKASRWLFAWSCIALVFSIAASGNGFFVVPVGLLVLAQDKRWKRIPVWLTVAIAMLILYVWDYNFHSSQTYAHGSVAESIFHLNAIYALSFLGSSAARYQSIVPSVIFGVVLVCFFLAAVKRKYYRQNPSVFYSMIFVLITAIGVSGLRSGSGVAQSLASRYRIYSNLMMAFCYLFMIENLFDEIKRKSIRRTILGAAFTLAIVFCVLSTLAGARFLHEKKRLLVQDMNDWQASPQQIPRSGVTAAADSFMAREIRAGVYRPRTSTLQESIRLGIYHPPVEER